MSIHPGYSGQEFMPDAFDQFFRLMGTSTEEQLNLVRLDPAYQTRNEGQQDKLLVRADVAAQPAHRAATID